MKVEGQLEGLILLFIDIGTSHNFITKELVSSLGLPPTENKELGLVWEMVNAILKGDARAW